MANDRFEKFTVVSVEKNKVVLRNNKNIYTTIVHTPPKEEPTSEESENEKAADTSGSNNS